MSKSVSKNTRKKKLGRYPQLMVIFSTTLALFVIGLFGMLLLHAARLSDKVKENLEMQVYLDRNQTEMQLVRLQKTFALKEYIAYKGSEAQVKFYPKEEGAKEFIKGTGEDFMSFLGENPLRDAYILRINPEFAETAKLREIKKDLESIDGVFEVQYVENLFNSINQNLRKASLILLSFAAILTLVVVVLINNTIKLALYSQRFLIRSMQLVGATAYFIQRPFLNRATVQGIVSGLIASMLLMLLLQYAYFEFPDLLLLRDEKQLILLMLFLIVMGSMIGFFSSFRAVNKYMRASLDELY
ncbi:cell division protein FtsX [Adhaeribacter soli]|uniref:Cell division protein FtsX n=1 Tax=Adhaeribacter soli TaxID=2607655 RepID=A0A5N1J569_9BACT|nr:permease-like cell division protein FtsX [Adhaeribacter soli]KAA9345867.1 ABC transporter permease [Adhaeribacter soli]